MTAAAGATAALTGMPARDVVGPGGQGGGSDVVSVAGVAVLGGLIALAILVWRRRRTKAAERKPAEGAAPWTGAP